MSTARVTIVRPRARFFETLIMPLLTSLGGGIVLTTLAPMATEGAWQPGYAQSAAIAFLVKWATADGSYLSWTRAEGTR